MNRSEDERRQAIVRLYQKVAQKKGQRWKIRPIRIDDRDQYERQSRQAFDVLGIDMSADEFQERVMGKPRDEEVTLPEFYTGYLRSMRDDIVQCLTQPQVEFFKNVHLHVLDTGVTNAQCVDRDPIGRELDYFLVFINSGMYFALQQLLVALVQEEMRGDLERYRTDGTEAYRAAIELYVSPTDANVGKVRLDLGDAEATGEVSAYQSSSATLILKFVALHEFAHAWLGHHRLLEASRLSLIVSDDDAEPAVADVAAHSDHEAEFEADEFAYRALMNVTRSVDSDLAHLFLMRLFFLWLEDIERRLGRPLSEQHPPPASRAERLKRVFLEAHPDADCAALDRVDELMDKWSANRVRT